MTNTDWDGIPDNPEVEGWHWLSNKDGTGLFSTKWIKENPSEFFWECEDLGTPEETAKYFSYVGPCLTPDEVGNMDAELTSAEAVIEELQIELEEMETEVQKLRKKIVEFEEMHGRIITITSATTSSTVGGTLFPPKWSVNNVGD